MSQASSPEALADRLRAAFAAHPVLGNQKKLRVGVFQGLVRVEGHVFTRDMLRQVDQVVARVAPGEGVRIHVDSEVRPPRPREIRGRVPETSPGGVNVDPSYSVRHLVRREADEAEETE